MSELSATRGAAHQPGRRGPLVSAVAALVAALPLVSFQPAFAQDASTYYTVTHASEFKIDWRAFYA
ncbi:MAG: hypothetical protein U0Q12_03935 [Vicinamibacterales bacterium]